jgi:hypothetical protein
MRLWQFFPEIFEISPLPSPLHPGERGGGRDVADLNGARIQRSKKVVYNPKYT